MSETPIEDGKVPAGAVVGVGCLTAVAGFFSGGMIAVMVGKAVGHFRGCVPLEGTPACDWHVYAAWGCLIGLVTLPTISIIRLKSRR